MKRSIIVISLLCSIAMAALLYTNAQSQTSFKSFTVTLYSGGRSVGTWESFQIADKGKDFVTFYIGSQPFPKTVTISGTYSIEQTQ